MRVTAAGRAASKIALTIVTLLLIVLPAQAQEVIDYYGTDHLGSVRVVFNAAGTVVSRADYLPFGEEVFAPTGPMPAERFTGQARDGEASQDYFHARMYQPRVGRFTAVDPVFNALSNPQKWNRYSYATSNPLVFVDPSGADPLLFVGAAVAEYIETVQLIGSSIATGNYVLVSGVTGQGAWEPGYGTFFSWFWSHLPDLAPLQGDEVSNSDLYPPPPKYEPNTAVKVGVDVAIAAAGLLAGRVGRGRGGIGPVLKGQAGEAAVRRLIGDIGPKLNIIVGGRPRIPDGLTQTTLTEIKFKDYQSWDAQLRDFAQFAHDTGRNFDLWVNEGITLSQSVLDAAAQGLVNIRYYVP